MVMKLSSSPLFPVAEGRLVLKSPEQNYQDEVS